MFGMKVFVETDADARLAKRVIKDTDELGRDMDQVHQHTDELGRDMDQVLQGDGRAWQGYGPGTSR